jgi:Cu-Zn family superoxide dismutase
MNRSIVTTATATAGLAVLATLGIAVPAVAGADVFSRTGDLTALGAATPETVPAGAAARLHTVTLPDGGSRWTLHVTGLAPNRTYGAHAHVAACSSEGGGHYGIAGPVSPETEVWLDFRTNDAGNARARAEQSWQFEPGSGPKSVIIHTDPTHPSTGAAGAKLACLDLDF